MWLPPLPLRFVRRAQLPSSEAEVRRITCVGCYTLRRRQLLPLLVYAVLEPHQKGSQLLVVGGLFDHVQGDLPV